MTKSSAYRTSCECALRRDAVSAFGHQPVQRVQVDIRQQRTYHRTLRRALRRRPPLQTLQDVSRQPAANQIEHPAIDDLRLDPRHERVVRDRIEVRLKISIHHIGVAILDQPIDLAQRVVMPKACLQHDAPSSRTEPIAPVAEPALEYGFNDEPHRLLDVVAKRAGRDAILDRGHRHIELH